MTVINNPSCIITQANLGIENCKPTLGIIKGMVALPAGTVLTDAECADLKTTLQALFIETAAKRAYPIGEILGFTDASKEEVMGTTGSYGAEEVVMRMQYGWKFEINNGLFWANRLRTFNNPNRGYEYLFFDDKGQAAGATSTTLGVVGLKGYSVNTFYLMDNKLPTGAANANPNTFLMTLKDPKEFNENIALISDATNNMELSDLKGMIDLTHTSVGGVLKISIGIQTADNKVNLYDLYKTEFAALAAFVIKKGGVVKNVGTTANDLVSIAGNDLTKKWDISLYAGSAGTDFTTELVSPAALAALGIGGLPESYFEDVTITTATVTAT